MCTDLVMPKSFPKWEMPFEQGPISKVRTLEKAELEAAKKILRIWTSVYALFPSKLTCGPLLTQACYHNSSTGKVLVGEDENGIVQVFARVIYTTPGLYVEELVTAPWNNFKCKEYLKSIDPRTFWPSGFIKIEKVSLLEVGKKVRIADIVTPHRGAGAIMMFALYHFTKHCGDPSLYLDSNPEAIGFYSKIGMSPTRGTRMFIYLINDPVFTELVKKVSQYFLKRAD